MHIPALDGLRGVAVLLVMISHANRDYAHAGWVGVEIFFILSGYLITGSIQKNSLKNFYIRRAARILPALIVFFFLYLLFSYFFDLKNELNLIISIVLFFSNWLFAFNFIDQPYITHLWSLAVEEQFYLLFPWFLLFVRFKKKGLFFIFLFFFIYKLHFIFLGDFQRFYYGTDTRLSSFLLGSLIYFFKDYKLGKNFISKYSISLYFLSMITIVFISFSSLGKETFIWVFFSNICAVILIALSLDSRFYSKNKILSNKYLVWIGKLSFSIYLFHGAIFSYMLYSQKNSMFYILIIGGAISVILSYLSYNYIENPVSNYIRKKYDK